MSITRDMIETDVSFNSNLMEQQADHSFQIENIVRSDIE